MWYFGNNKGTLSKLQIVDVRRHSSRVYEGKYLMISFNETNARHAPYVVARRAKRLLCYAGAELRQFIVGELE